VCAARRRLGCRSPQSQAASARSRRLRLEQSSARCGQSSLFLSSPAHELRFAKVDLALDPSARLVLEVAAPVKLVHALAFGLDQAELDLVVQVLRRPMLAVDLPTVIDSAQALALLRA